MTIAAPAERSLELELAVTAEAVPRTQWQLFRRRFFHHKLAVFGLVMLVIITIMCYLPSLFAPGYHSGFDIATALSGAHGPTAKHWLGTDEQGQDFFYVLLKSGQISLKIGFLVAALSTAFGVMVGSTAGYFGKWVDGPLSALIDLFLVMPFIAVIAVLLQYEGHSPTWMIVALSLVRLDVRRAHLTRAGAVAEGEGVRRGRTRVGCPELADHSAPHAPEHDRADHGEPHLVRRLRGRR